MERGLKTTWTHFPFYSGTPMRKVPTYMTIDRVSNLTPEAFERDYYRANKPVIITDEVSQWGALDWSPEWFREHYSEVETPVYVGPRAEAEIQFMTIGEYFRRLEDPSQQVYMNQVPIFRLVPELRAHIAPPKNVVGDRLVYPFLWMGRKGTYQPLHVDHTFRVDAIANFFAQIRGRKIAVLAAWPEENENLYIKSSFGHDMNSGGHDTDHFCEVDHENVDMEKHPRFADAKLYEAIIHPGDMLYVPAQFWHSFRHLDDCISISNWWRPDFATDMAARFLHVAENAGKWRCPEVSARPDGLGDDLDAFCEKHGKVIDGASIEEIGGYEMAHVGMRALPKHLHAEFSRLLTPEVRAALSKHAASAPTLQLNTPRSEDAPIKGLDAFWERQRVRTETTDER